MSENPSSSTQSKPMRLLIIETSIRGHRPTYLQRIVREAMNRDFHVTLAMAEDSFKHPIIEGLYADYPLDRLESVSCKPVKLTSLPGLAAVNLVIYEIVNRRFFATAYKKATLLGNPDFVLLPHFDSIANATALLGVPFGGHPWGGIVMRQSFHYQEMGIVGPTPSLIGNGKKKLFLRLLKNAQDKGTLLTIDPSLPEYIGTRFAALSSVLRYLPDPAEIEQTSDTAGIRESLGIPADSVVILLYGSLLVGKGLQYLLTALPELEDNVHVLLAGKQDPAVNASLVEFQTRKPDLAIRIHELNRYIADSEEASIFKTANIVWIGYKGHYAMSGVMIQAARSSVPVIATREGLIGWLTDKFSIGIVTDTTSTPHITKSVKSLTDGSFIVEQSNFKAFYENHTIEAFHNALFDAIEQNNTTAKSVTAQTNQL